ncbi:MAG: protein kinase [Myxococcales bacterium]|nr:protein kinase [Myxococcales bacterium]
MSPKNVMVSYAGHVKVIDFGIAKARGRLVRTQTGVVRGTVSYMAPEQLGEGKVDARTDLYAVAIVLYELLTGERLFKREGALTRTRLAPPRPENPRKLNPDVSPALGAAVLKALETEPKNRFESGKAFARAIEEACPNLADEEAVAAFMRTLFESQLQSTQALFDAAQQDAEPEQLSGLVQGLVAAPEKATPAPAPKRADRVATRKVPGAVAKEGPNRARWLAGAGAVAALGLAVAIAWRVDAEPAAAIEPPAPIDLKGKAPPPPDVSLALRRADAALGSASYARALEGYEEVLAAAPSDWSARLGAGIAARKLRQYEKARAHLWQALAIKKPASPAGRSTAHFELGCVMAHEGQPSAALAALEKAMNLVPDAAGRSSLLGALTYDPDLTTLRGDVRFQELTRKLGEPAASPQAEQLCDEATKLSRARNYEAAVTKLERCVKIAPRHPACHRILGSTWARLAARDSDARAMDKAKKAYERYLEVAPPDDEYVPKVKLILEQAPK